MRSLGVATVCEELRVRLCGLWESRPSEELRLPGDGLVGSLRAAAVTVSRPGIATTVDAKTQI